MKNRKKLQPWILILAGVTILVNVATGLAASGKPELLLRSTLLPAGILTISPRLETESGEISVQPVLNSKEETRLTTPDSIR